MRVQPFFVRLRTLLSHPSPTSVVDTTPSAPFLCAGYPQPSLSRLRVRGRVGPVLSPLASGVSGIIPQGIVRDGTPGITSNERGMQYFDREALVAYEAIGFSKVWRSSPSARSPYQTA
jgi:hypothetical protein